MTLNNSELVGRVVSDHTATSVEIDRGTQGYRVSAGFKVSADILNLNGSAAGMTEGSHLHLGGTHRKRIRETETPTGETYVYVEVME